MSPEEVVALIVSLPGVQQSAHFGTVDFRVANRIFATRPTPGDFNLKLSREQQAMLTESEPAMFRPVPNKWGEKGWTTAQADALDAVTALSAFRMAWSNVAPTSSKR